MTLPDPDKDAVRDRLDRLERRFAFVAKFTLPAVALVVAWLAFQMAHVAHWGGQGAYDVSLLVFALVWYSLYWKLDGLK